MKSIICDKAFFSRQLAMPQKQRDFYKHSHAGFELYAILSGNAEFIVENKTYRLNPYDMILIKPMQYHALHLKSNDMPYDRCIIDFSHDFLPAHIIPDRQFFSMSENSSVIKQLIYLDKISTEYSEDDKEIAFKSMLSDIMLRLKYSSTAPQRESLINSFPLVDKIIKYVNENLSEDISLTTLSKALFISPSHISHTFKQHMKISIMQYVRQKKVMYAHSLILSGIKPTKAAELCKFNSYTSFYRAYNQIFGGSPKEVKQNASR